MKRLTEIETKGPHKGKWTYGMEVSVGNLCEKLAAYEDVDLTPDQISDLLQKMQQLTARIAELEEAARWVPIGETMPESGTHVLLGCETRPNGKTYVCDGYFAKKNTITCGSTGDVNSDYSEEDDEYYLAEGFYEIIKNWDDFGSITISDFVTHWMKLPDAPKGERDDG